MIPYIINAGLILTGCLAFYKILLQKETFYRLNRYVLVVCLIISFGLPLLPIPQQWSLRKAETASVQQVQQQNETAGTNTAAVEPSTASPIHKAEAPGSTISFQQVMTWLIYLYWFGVIVFGLNFLAQLVVLLYRAYTKPVIVDGQYRIVEVSGDKAPCSFANNIFINPEKYEWDTYNQILLHEKVHIQQKHSLDLLLAELVLIFQWFNPFAWQYRKEVENNLEFLTDDHLVEHKKIEVSSYQLSLLKVSTPHFPLSLTTNYNQSLLKKRIAMMNAKKSNVHTAWKYFFLLPLLVLFACLLNEPVAYSQSYSDRGKDKSAKDADKMERNLEHKMATEGYWFATIKGDKISIQFKRDEDDNSSMSNSTFSLDEFPNLPKGSGGTFKLTREAGTMEFNGKFEGDQGMGRYRFVPDNQYGSYIGGQINEKLDDEDLMVFFFIDIKKSYVNMLKDQGYDEVTKNDLIPLAALGIDQSYIRSIKESGYKNISLQNLIPLKSLGVDGAYISEIRSAGYPNITVNQLITFKAQGIDKNYLEKVRPAVQKDNAKSKKDKGNQKDDDEYDADADDIVTFKALKIDEEYINSFKEVGYTQIPNHELVAMKSLGVTPAFIKSFQAIGYKNISPSEAIPMKAQNITPEFIKGFEAIGYSDISLEQAITLKAMKITPQYITSMKEKGFNYRDLHKYVTLKSIDE